MEPAAIESVPAHRRSLYRYSKALTIVGKATRRVAIRSIEKPSDRSRRRDGRDCGRRACNTKAATSTSRRIDNAFRTLPDMYVERGVERDDQRRRGWPRDPSTRATPESLHPVRIEGSVEGKTRLVLDLADPIRIRIYLRT